MAHFSHHSSNNILDNDQTVFVPNPNVGTSSCFPDQFHHQLSHGHSFLGYQHDHVSVANKLQIPDSSVSLLLLDGKKIVDQNGNELVLERNGKDKQMSSVCQPHQSKDTSKRLKKQKKTSDYDQEEVNKKNTRKVSSSSSKEEGTVGYVHVRARRGQATDSHSLAERVRREKISERMKVLQSIVPGCDKVTGKAPMLDEIINYVRSLQNQVELLSMKLATLNPMLYDFGVDLDAFMLKSNENMSSSMAVPSLQHYSQNATFAPTNFNYINHQRLNIDGSGGATNYSQSFPQSQMPIIHSQGNVYRLWDVDEQIRKKNDNRFAVCNSFAFQ